MLNKLYMYSVYLALIHFTSVYTLRFMGPLLADLVAGTMALNE